MTQPQLRAETCRECGCDVSEHGKYADGTTPQKGDVVRGAKGRKLMVVTDWDEHRVFCVYQSGNRLWHGIKWPVVVRRAGN